MISVLYDYQIFSAQQYGGISRYFCELFNYINNYDDCCAHIYSPIFVNEYLNKPDVGVTGFRLPNWPYTFRLRQALNNTADILHEKIYDYSIVHETFYFKQRAHSKRARVVTTIHDMIHELYRNDLPNAHKFIEEKRRAVDRSDAVICVSENTRSDLLRFIDVDPEKVFVVHHGFSQLHKPIVTPDYLRRPYILYVGSREIYKNFEGLLHAFSSDDKLFKNLQLICFGGGTFTCFEKSLIDACGLSDQNILQISGDDSLLASAYRNAAAFVLPSFYEGFGIPSLEAMSLDCPVICSNSGSIPEVVGNAAQIFDPFDIDAISDSIERVVFSKDRRLELVTAGHDRLNEFSWDKCASKTREIYISLL